MVLAGLLSKTAPLLDGRVVHARVSVKGTVRLSGNAARIIQGVVINTSLAKT